MNIPDIQAFVAVVETGSIVAASTRLNLTQPAVTRRVQNLESAVGKTLLDRHSKPLKPTTAGRSAYEHGRRVLHSIENMKAEVSPEGELSGEFRLGVMPYLSNAALSLPIDRLRAEFPRLSLKVGSGWSPRLIEQVQRNEIDAAAICLAEGIKPPDDLVSQSFGLQNVLLVAAPSLGIRSPATLLDLSRHPWVMNESGCGYRTFMRETFDAARLPFDIAVETISSDLRLSLVARGMGIGIITPSALIESQWRDAVAVIETVDFHPKVEVWLLHRPPAGRLADPIARFGQALSEALNSV